MIRNVNSCVVERAGVWPEALKKENRDTERTANLVERSGEGRSRGRGTDGEAGACVSRGSEQRDCTDTQGLGRPALRPQGELKEPAETLQPYPVFLCQGDVCASLLEQRT